MKILQVINNLATGGAEKLLVESVPKYIARGIEMEVLVLNGTEYPFSVDLQKHTRLFSLGKHSFYNPIHIFKVIPFLKKYDIIHVHLFPSLYWVALAKWLTFSKTKIVFTEHSTSNKRMGNGLMQKLDRFIYAKHDAIICITTEVKNQLKRHLRFPDEKFTVIENGIDLTKIQNATSYLLSDLGLPNNAKTVVQVASFQFPKDQTTVIKSLPYLPDNVHLLLVGEGPLQNEAKMLSQNLDLNHRVHFLGVRMDVPNLLKTADVIVLSSQYEGLSLSCIEGMASGKPFVASDVPGLKEIVSGNGLLFPFQDEKKLAEVVKDLLEDDEKYAATAKKCRTKAQQYDITTMIENHIKLYESLL